MIESSPALMWMLAGGLVFFVIVLPLVQHELRLRRRLRDATKRLAEHKQRDPSFDWPRP